MNAISYAISVFNALLQLVPPALDAYSLIEKTRTDLQTMQDENRDPTDAEWEALNTTIEKLRSLRPTVTI